MFSVSPSKVQLFRLVSCSSSSRRRKVRTVQMQSGDGSSAHKTAIVIVDHGSRREAANRLVVDVAKIYQQKNVDKIVEAAHMELAEPTIEQAIGKCYREGAMKIVVAPFFLAKGKHSQEDIPRIVKEVEKLYPNIVCVIAEPLGIDPLLIDILMKRVDQALINNLVIK